MADSSTIFVGVHKGCTSNHSDIKVAFLPPKALEPFALFLYKPFNNKEHVIALSIFHKDFLDSGCTASNPTSSETPINLYRAKRIYRIHRHDDNKPISAGAGVYDTSGLCPPFCATNSDLFASTFGVEFDNDATIFAANCLLRGNQMLPSS